MLVYIWLGSPRVQIWKFQKDPSSHKKLPDWENENEILKKTKNKNIKKVVSEKL